MRLDLGQGRTGRCLPALRPGGAGAWCPQAQLPGELTVTATLLALGQRRRQVIGVCGQQLAISSLQVGRQSGHIRLKLLCCLLW